MMNLRAQDIENGEKNILAFINEIHRLLIDGN